MTSRFFENPYEDYDESKHGTLETDIFNRNTAIQLVQSYVDKILIGTKKSQYKLRDDLYVGEAGIAFMFWKLSRSDDFRHLYPCLEHASFYIQRAKEISQAKRDPSSDTARIAFLCGNSGITAISAAILNDIGKANEASCDIASFLTGHTICISSYDADEVLVGRAGYLSGAYWLNQVLQSKPIKNNIIEDVCNKLIQRGREYSRSKRSPLPLMYEYHDSDYLGAAHGLCSVLHMLLESPWFVETQGTFNNISATKLHDIQNSIEYLLTMQDEDGNFPTRLLNSNKKLIHWCHGCAGVIYVLAKAYLLFKDDKYLRGCRKCTEAIWRQGLLRKGPGICHGVAGNGYAFLLMYRLTQEKKYLYRAAKFMEFLTTDQFVEEARSPDRPFSLYEGFAGTVCFLVDIMNPRSAYFPFMDVFDVKFNST
ncbi:lanC-like protein 3 homolog [Topomyia yanbarensis]|uniref:lanC-like protein 3 homolog n=1 Tax=Topomyia yanbarensis TaxID=2498891 RepID=UPI00273B38CF|nr:lanC-like protein 3 homolog [Topomyia yanbarensis]